MCHLLTCRTHGVSAWPQVETSDVMVGVEDMFAMNLSDVIGKEQREELVSLGFSRCVTTPFVNYICIRRVTCSVY
jgi:hypothetical protein